MNKFSWQTSITPQLMPNNEMQRAREKKMKSLNALARITNIFDTIFTWSHAHTRNIRSNCDRDNKNTESEQEEKKTLLQFPFINITQVYKLCSCAKSVYAH